MKTKRGVVRGWLGRGCVCALAVVTAGCYKHTYEIGAGAPAGRVVYDEWRHHWIAGLISPDHESLLDEVCPSGNATVLQQTTFLNGLVAALTSGIYSPTSVTVRCATGQAQDLDIDPASLESMAGDPAFLEWIEAVVPERADEVRSAQAQQDR